MKCKYCKKEMVQVNESTSVGLGGGSETSYILCGNCGAKFDVWKERWFTKDEYKEYIIKRNNKEETWIFFRIGVIFLLISTMIDYNPAKWFFIIFSILSFFMFIIGIVDGRRNINKRKIRGKING